MSRLTYHGHGQYSVTDEYEGPGLYDIPFEYDGESDLASRVYLPNAMPKDEVVAEALAEHTGLDAQRMTFDWVEFELVEAV